MRLTPHYIHPGDMVEFELGRNDSGTIDGYPRWLDHEDRGPTGVWQAARVAEVTGGDVCVIEYRNPVTQSWEIWPFAGFGWDDDRPGWPRPVEPRSCECGALKTLGSGPHSDWCPLYDPRLSPGAADKR